MHSWKQRNAIWNKFEKTENQGEEIGGLFKNGMHLIKWSGESYKEVNKRVWFKGRVFNKCEKCCDKWTLSLLCVCVGMLDKGSGEQS